MIGVRCIVFYQSRNGQDQKAFDALEWLFQQVGRVHRFRAEMGLDIEFEKNLPSILSRPAYRLEAAIGQRSTEGRKRQEQLGPVATKSHKSELLVKS